MPTIRLEMEIGPVRPLPSRGRALLTFPGWGSHWAPCEEGKETRSVMAPPQAFIGAQGKKWSASGSAGGPGAVPPSGAQGASTKVGWGDRAGRISSASQGPWWKRSGQGGGAQRRGFQSRREVHKSCPVLRGTRQPLHQSCWGLRHIGGTRLGTQRKKVK